VTPLTEAEQQVLDRWEADRKRREASPMRVRNVGLEHEERAELERLRLEVEVLRVRDRRQGERIFELERRMSERNR
jgi:hypothetical protein